MKKVESYIISKKRGYHTVMLYISTQKELEQESYFDYINKKTAMKKLNELKKEYKLQKHVYNDYSVSYINENFISVK